jgi:hypothetical protein
MKTKVIKENGRYAVKITIETQSFYTMDFELKRHANLYKRRFDEAIKEEMERYYKTERQKEKDVFL